MGTMLKGGEGRDATLAKRMVEQCSQERVRDIPFYIHELAHRSL